jgi:hypothetical protein
MPDAEEDDVAEAGQPASPTMICMPWPSPAYIRTVVADPEPEVAEPEAGDHDGAEREHRGQAPTEPPEERMGWDGPGRWAEAGAEKAVGRRSPPRIDREDRQALVLRSQVRPTSCSERPGSHRRRSQVRSAEAGQDHDRERDEQERDAQEGLGA